MMSAVTRLTSPFAASFALTLAFLGLLFPAGSWPIARRRKVGVVRVLVELPGKLGNQMLELCDSSILVRQFRLELSYALITRVHLRALVISEPTCRS